MKKEATFTYNGKKVVVTNTDPSSPGVTIDKPWSNIEQELFDQLDDSKVFTKEELVTLSDMRTPDFIACLSDFKMLTKVIKVPVKIYTFIHKDTAKTISFVFDDNRNESDSFEEDIFGEHYNISGFWKVSASVKEKGHKEVITNTEIEVEIPN